MATTVSIPGAGTAPPLVFTVTGTATTAQAVAFQNALQKASHQGNLHINILSNAPGQRAHGPSHAPVVLNEIFSNSAVNAYTLSSGAQYTLVDVGVPTTVTGSAAGGDSILGAGDATYLAGTGGDNMVTFIDGTNTYTGGAESGDTVTAGSGYDTIQTGTGATTVFSGTGSAHVTLNDTAGGDVAVLTDGQGASLTANGLGDVIYASSPGDTIYGGAATSGNLLLTISPSSAPGGAGDLFVGGAGVATVFDSAGSNTIAGGTGSLFFVTGPGVSDTVASGTGSVGIFGNSGVNITLTGSSSVPSSLFVAGDGNETLNGAGAGSFAFFGDTAATAANDSVIGGTGSDYFLTGAGTENFTAGSGTDLFVLSTVPGANITITDFAAKDYVAIAGQDSATTAQQLASGTVSGGNYTVTLSDNTTITFVGLTSFNGHTT